MCKRHFLKLFDICCSCSFYKQREYFITGGGDGQVKVSATCNYTVSVVFLLFHGFRIFLYFIRVFFININMCLFSLQIKNYLILFKLFLKSNIFKIDLYSLKGGGVGSRGKIFIRLFHLSLL